MEKRNKDIIVAAFLIIFIVLLLAGIPYLIGLGKAGFQEETIMRMWTFYLGPAAFFLLGLIACIILEYIFTKDDKTYGDSILFNSPGELPALPVPFFNNYFRTILIIVIFSSLLAFTSIYTQTTFSVAGTLEQQFTNTDNILFKAFLIPIAENLFPAFLVAAFLVILRYVARKYNWGKGIFWTLAIFGTLLLYTLSGIIGHMMRYSGSDVAILNVGIFWFIGGILNLLTGGIISFWILHFINNFFLDLAQYYNQDAILIGTIISIIILIFVYVLLYVGAKKIKPLPNE